MDLKTDKVQMGKFVNTFSFPPLRLDIEKLKTDGKIKFKRLCFQFLHKGGEFVLVAYKLNKKREWIDFELSDEKKFAAAADSKKEFELTSSGEKSFAAGPGLQKDFVGTPELIYLEVDPEAAPEEAVQFTVEDLLFTQLEMSASQVKLAIKTSKGGWLRFKPGSGRINPYYISYNVEGALLANPCPPAPPPDDSGVAGAS